LRYVIECFAKNILYCFINQVFPVNIFKSNPIMKKILLFFVEIMFLTMTAQAQSNGANIQNASQFAKDRVLVKLANTPGMRSTASGPGAAYSPPNLGIAFSGIRLLNPSLGNASINAFSTMNADDKQNNVYVLTLEETGEEAVERALEILNANPAVEIAEPVFYYKFFATPNDPMFSEQYALSIINAQQAWNSTTGSKSVVVGVIDTGIDGTHLDLKNNLWVNPNPNHNGYTNDIHGYDFVSRKGGIPTDKGNHGTHICGIIGAKGNNGTGITGINWDVSLAWLGVGIDGNQASIDAVIEALNYANNHNIQITNNSYGGVKYSVIFEGAIRNYNGLFVAAAGNDRNNNDSIPEYPAGYKLPNVISVAATDRNNNLWSLSNFGRNSVHIAAPGSGILSTISNGQYQQMSGTSMATPHVVGVAALIKSIKPDLSPAQIRGILIATARLVSSLDGFGILDADAALMAVTNNLSPTIDLNRSNPPSVGLRWTYSNNVYTVGNGANISITGNNGGSARRVEIAASATVLITLENASITTSYSPLLLNSGANATLTLVGSNILTGGNNCAGIQTIGAKLTIGGTGSLTAIGGNGGAGIGGGAGGSGGNIAITGGVVKATGGSNAQGIGRGSGSSAPGTLAINGNAVVVANSVGDTSTGNKKGGILFNGSNGTFYGESVTISTDVTFPINLTIPENRTLIIPKASILTIPGGITLTNNGTIMNYGKMTIAGTLMLD
jgi:subtilisin family serine protease